MQPLDISVNKAAKNFMHDQFQRWHAEQIQQQVHDNVKNPVDLRLSIVKPFQQNGLFSLVIILKHILTLSRMVLKVLVLHMKC